MEGSGEFQIPGLDKKALRVTDFSKVKKWVLEFKTAEKWLRGVRKHGTGSVDTQERYITALAKECIWAGKTPDELIEEALAKERYIDTVEHAQDLCGRYFDYYLNQGRTRGFCYWVYSTARSFYRYNGVKFTEKGPKTWVEKTTRMPDKTQLQDVLEACLTLREKFIILGLRSTGMSPKDFVSLKIGQAYIKEDLARDEARIYIERRRIKEMTRTQVFFDLEATKALKDYLRYRRDKLDEKITDETPLVRSEHATEAGEVEAITTGQLGRLVSEIGERAGVKITPKIFRKYFRTQCGNSIGRKNEHILIMGGWKIPGAGPNYQYPSKEEMLDDYIKSEPFLRFQKPQAEESEEERNLRTLKDIARSLNMDPLEVFKRKTKDKPLTMQEKREALLAEITFVKQRMRTEPAGGGLAYTQALAKELGKVIADAIRETKEQLKQQ